MADPVALPPSFARRAAVGVVLLLLALLGLVVNTTIDRIDPNWVNVGANLVAGVAVLVRAWVLRRQPALLLDDEGVKHRRGTLLLPWAEAALVWVVDLRSLGSRGPGAPSLWVWSAPSLDYAQRTGFAPQARLTRVLATTLPADEVADAVRRFTAAPVHSGSMKDLRRMLGRLRSGEDVDFATG